MYPLIDDKEFINALPVSQSTLSRYIKDGFPVYKLPNFIMIIDLNKAEAWLKKSRSKKRQALGEEVAKYSRLRNRNLTSIRI